MVDAQLPPVPEMHLELVPLPVSDVDRAKAFYERIGFGNLHDTVVSDGMRVVQLTPPGSACAIVFGTGMGPISDMVPGTLKGLHLVLRDIEEARAALVAREVEASEVQDIGGVRYVWFADPDGNLWGLQQWPEGHQGDRTSAIDDEAAAGAPDEVDERLARHGGLTYLEIPTLAPAASAAFYEHVLGWSTEKRAPGDVRFRDPEGLLIGRWVEEREAHATSGLLAYFYVDDIDEALRRVEAWGGKVAEGPRPEGNLRVAQVRDPAGNLLGLWQAPAG